MAAAFGLGRRAVVLAAAAVSKPGVLGQLGAQTTLPSLQFRCMSFCR